MQVPRDNKRHKENKKSILQSEWKYFSNCYLLYSCLPFSSTKSQLVWLISTMKLIYKHQKALHWDSEPRTWKKPYQSWQCQTMKSLSALMPTSLDLHFTLAVSLLRFPLHSTSMWQAAPLQGLRMPSVSGLGLLPPADQTPTSYSAQRATMAGHMIGNAKQSWPRSCMWFLCNYCFFPQSDIGNKILWWLLWR